jgi:hypothetical protein
MARSGGGAGMHRLRGPDSKALLEVARNDRLAASTRAGALQAMAEWWWPDQATPEVLAAVLALADDDAPEVRAAALSLRLGDKPAASVVAELRRLWQKEKDARAACALASRFHEIGVAPAPSQGVGLPIVAAWRRRHAVQMAWSDFGRQWAGSRVAIIARSGARERRVELPDGGSWSSGGESGGMGGYLFFDPPLEPGRWELTMSFTLANGAEQRPENLPLAPIVVASAGADAPSGVEPPHPAPSAVAPVQVEPVRPRPRSCGCAIAARDDAPAALCTLPVVAFLARRRRRLCVRAPHSAVTSLDRAARTNGSSAGARERIERSRFQVARASSARPDAS